MILASCDRRLWGRPARPVCGSAGLVAVGVLMWGGVFGLTYVETRLWSGLPLTLILAVVGMAFAFPLAILLALGRRSQLPAVRAICVAYIELVRGVPLITVLFMASVMLPLFLPTGITIDKLLRAQIAFILFAAAYLAEVVRGGLQAIPKGQIEAADALGPRLLAAHPADRAAAGAGDGDPAAGQHLHRHLQGHLAGHHHRPVRPARHRQRGADRRQLAGLLRSRPMSSSRRSISASAFSCRATARCWSASSTRAGGGDCERRRADRAEPIIEMRHVHKWYGEFHVLKDINSRSARASGSSSAARRAPANRR